MSIVVLDAEGNIKSKGTVVLTSADVSGILPIANGGTSTDGRNPVGDITIPTNEAIFVPGYYKVASGKSLTVSAGAELMVFGGSGLQPAGSACSVYSTIKQLMADGVFTTINFNTVDAGYESGMWSAATPSRVTIPAGQGGLYLLIASTRAAISATSVQYALQLLKNGSSVGTNGVVPSAGIQLDFQIVRFSLCVAGDYFELQGFTIGDVAGVLFGATVRQTASQLQVAKVLVKM